RAAGPQLTALPARAAPPVGPPLASTGEYAGERPAIRPAFCVGRAMIRQSAHQLEEDLMDHEIETVTEYPATVVGYFEERAPAEAALAELEQMDFGPLGEGFEKANIFYRDVPGQAIVSGEKRTRQNADQEEIENLPGDVAVVARGK